MYKRQQRIFVWSFLLPGLILYTVFVVYPSLRGIQISLYDWSGLSMNMDWVGLENFATLWREFTDPDDYYNIRLYLSHNLFLFIFSLITIVLALVAAALIHNKPRGYNVFRITYFFPNVLAIPAIAVLWSMTLNPEYGIVNALLKAVGLESLALPWMSLQYELPFFRLGLYTVGFIIIWGGLGWFMILFLASIQNIPKELTEAAEIDGATRTRAFFAITIPLIWETVRTVMIFAVIGALNTFALTFVLFEQNPNKHSDVIMNYYYWQAFSNNNWGYASAIVVLIFVVTMIASLLAYRVFERDAVQY